MKVETKMTDLIFEIKENIGYITFNRPDVGNSINHQMAKEMALWTEDTLMKLTNRLDFHGIILSGSQKHFITGADVSEFLKGTDYIEEMTANARKFMRIFHNITPNAVAAVDGYALGGGLEVALGCDYIIATPRSNFGFPEIKFGLIPGAGGTQLLPQRVGYHKATEMILTGDLISAEEAHEQGLVDEIAKSEDILDAAKIRAYGGHLNHSVIGRHDKETAHHYIDNTYQKIDEQGRLAGPHYAINAALDCLRASLHRPDYDRETEHFAECLNKEETHKRIKSFLERID